MTRRTRALLAAGAVVAVAAVIGAVAVLVAIRPRPAEKPVALPITSDFFGVHQARLDLPGQRGWPQAPFGSIRLWDDGVAWVDLESAPGRFHWRRLDRDVARARAHGSTVLLVLGQTPRFHSNDLTSGGFYGAGSTAMPRSKAAWQRYVRAVARRNIEVWGRAVSFQVWNEANNRTYWRGSPHEMAVLTRWAREEIDSVDPTATLVGPALTVRLPSQRSWIDAFYAQRVNRRPVAADLDAVAVNLYPRANGGPEDSMRLLRKVRRILGRRGVDEPVYATEIDYGLSGRDPGAPAARISSADQVGNAARTFLLGAQEGLSRVYWYAWDLPRLGNTPMVARNRATPSAAGRAVGVVRAWIVGTRPAGCAVSSRGTYRCTFLDRARRRQVVWNPTRRVSAPVPADVGRYTTSLGEIRTVRRGGRVTVGPAPILLLADRSRPT